MGEWQKIFVRKLVEQGLTHEHAMLAMGLTCEERSNAYMEGHGKGFNSGFENGKVSYKKLMADQVVISETEFSQALNKIRQFIDTPENPAARLLARIYAETLDDYRPSKLAEYMKQQEAKPE